jgi:hypothetical protein
VPRERREELKAPPPEVDLPEKVAGGVETLGEEGVVDREGVDVRYAPTVHEDLGRTLKSLKA